MSYYQHQQAMQQQHHQQHAGYMHPHQQQQLGAPPPPPTSYYQQPPPPPHAYALQPQQQQSSPLAHAAAYATPPSPAIPSIHQHRLQQQQQLQQSPPHFHSPPPPPAASYYQPSAYHTPPYAAQAYPQHQPHMPYLNMSHMSPPHPHAPPQYSLQHPPPPPPHAPMQPAPPQQALLATPTAQVVAPIAAPVAVSPSTPAPASASKGKQSKAAKAAAASTTNIATIFSDLDSRFLVNLPDEELSSFERIMFQLQQAHWFYLDFYSDRNPALPRFSYKVFCETFFRHIPSFAQHISKFEQVYASFNHYLSAVPVCGCILVNPEQTHVVMVRSWVGNVWGFPRGKLDANEDEITCAMREVDEEIGFDCRPWFKGYEIVGPGQAALTRQTSSESTSSTTSSVLQAQQPSYIEAQSSSKVIRLYILQGVPNSSVFQTRTRKEIGQIAWVPVSALPHSKSVSNTSAGYIFSNAMQLFAGKIRTFLKKLKTGEITGYGHYETDQSNGQRQPKQQQQQQQADGGNKSARKPKDQQPQQQPQQQQQQAPTRKHSGGGHAKQLSAFDESKNAQTFASSSSGWSPEQMFAANARLGVVTTVQEEKLQLPAHLDAKLDAALGRKPQQASGKKGQKKTSVILAAPPAVASSTSEPLSIVPAAKSYKPHVPAPELDYAHNPYTTFANLNLHLQPNSAQPIATAAAKPVAQAAAASNTVATNDQPQSAGKPKQQRQKKNGGSVQQQAQPASAVVPQYRIQKRPTSAADQVTSTAPAAPAVPVANASGDAVEFQFDLASIMEPI